MTTSSRCASRCRVPVIAVRRPSRAFDRALIEKLQSLPGVQAASIASNLPTQGRAISATFEIAGRPLAPSARPRGIVHYASDGYFRTLGMALRKGRLFTAQDEENAPHVIVINETFAKRYFAGEDAIGHRLIMDGRWMGQPAAPAIPWEVVGIIADVKLGALNGRPEPQIYVPLMQCAVAGGVVALRTDRNPQRLGNTARDAIHELDRSIPITDVRTLEEVTNDSVSRPRAQTLTLTVFALIGLLLAALGNYGVVSYTVAEGMREMGIRLAMGARPADLIRRTLRRSALTAGAGVLAGVVGSLALTHVIASELYAVKATDPATYIAVSLLMLAVALAAAYAPARRALRVDPAIALRSPE